MAIQSSLSRAIPRVEPPASPHHWNPGNYIADPLSDISTVETRPTGR